MIHTKFMLFFRNKVNMRRERERERQLQEEQVSVGGKVSHFCARAVLGFWCEMNIFMNYECVSVRAWLHFELYFSSETILLEYFNKWNWLI